MPNPSDLKCSILKMQKLAVVLFYVIITGCPHGFQAISPNCTKPERLHKEFEESCHRFCLPIVTPLTAYVQQLQDELKWRKKYPGFEKYGHGLFYVEQARLVNWAGAIAACHRKGAQLAEFEDDEEFQAIMKKSSRKGTYWLGIIEGKDGRFTSEATKKPARFLNWIDGEPMKLKDRACVATSSGQGIFTQPCQQINNYICRVELPLKKK
ncbi:CD209 antigen-like protein B [Drosophila teissieri]|uniref:CD209 antigen-like protein B n=1 Tax=Drosophila teissieri TaxID=7243 RepID=UPI001CB9F72E|nr:CD209 antigen-like protein B [Drosophila teissieri]